MKKLFNKYFNKYCDFIGVENEGYRRLFILSWFITPFLYGQIVDGGFISDLLRGREDEWFGYFFILLPWSVILNGVFVKIYIWVKDGFSK